MARGPFQGTFQPGIRPTVVTAPDAIVLINGESDVLGCPKCKRRFEFNRYITTVQVDLSVESAPGSASFSLSLPRHMVDSFYFDGEPLILPMMEVEIFAKGYFLVEGLPQYYPIFWGLTTDISDSYSGGEHSVSVNCADILKWWDLCRMNINPAFTQALGQEGRNLFGNVYSGRNPYDVIWSLAQQSFGDLIVGSGSLLSMYKETAQKATFSAYMGDVMQYWEERFSKIRSNLLLYGTRGNAVRGDVIYEIWNRTPGNQKFIEGTGEKARKGSGFVSKLVRKANGGQEGIQMVFDPTDQNVTAFRTQFMNAGQVNFWQSEYETKLELANSAKDCIGFEFFMDVTGDIVFKPPFYNLDILGNKPVSWIQDIDIIDWDLSESESEVVTQVQINGSYGGNTDFGFGEEMTPATSVTDYHLLRRYGWRVRPFNSEFMGSTIHMFYMGMDLLDQYNAKRFRGTVNIPMRPELRLGFPIYLAPKDQIWYITGISHNISFGGRAQTTLNLTAKRSKFVAPKGIGTLRLSKYNGAPPPSGDLSTPTPSAQQLAKSGEFIGDVGDAAQVPPTNYPEKPGDANPYEPLILRHPKTGRLVGYPNVVMAYTRPFAVPPEDFRKVAGQKKDPKRTKRGAAGKPKNKNSKENEAALRQLTEQGKTYQQNKKDRIREDHLQNRFSFGLTSAGVYTYLHDQSSVIKEMLLMNKSKIKFKDEATGADENPLYGKGSALIRPVSDERGFEVIGHYKYGRNVSLRDGSLVINETAENPGVLNSRAAISPQVAVSGDLFEVLQAQSQGLVSVYTGFPNPARLLATLDPTDTQTAGIINPKTKEPEFSSVDNNFVDVAPLGSPEQEGASNKYPASVEASQLSRALTLAELKVFTDSDPTVEGCGCLMSRADLAFINTGYQVKVLRTTTEDNTSISFGTISSDVELEEIRQRQTAIAESIEAAQLEAAQNAREAAAQDPSGPLSEEQTQALIEQQVQRARELTLQAASEEYGISLEQVQAEAEEGSLGDRIRPVAEPSLSREQAISRVEEYLTNLYKILDGPHQEYEKTIRGEYTSIPGSRASSNYFGYNSGFDNISPPFSPSGRDRGGEPLSLGAQGFSARQDIEQAWDRFSSDIKSKPARTKLEGEVRQTERKISELEAEIANIEKRLKTGTVFGTEDQLTDLKKELDEQKKKLAEQELELSNLNQEFPP